MLDTLFLKAQELICSDADFGEIKALLDAHPDIAKLYFPDDKANLLCHAIKQNNLPVVHLLLDHQSLIEPDGDLTDVPTPLFLALKLNNPYIASLLIERGARVNATFKGYYLLQLAVFAQYTGIVQALLKHPDINVNQSISMASKPLWSAVQDGNLEIMNLLLERGADVNCVLDGQNNTLLHAMAAYIHSPDVITRLLKAPGIKLEALNNLSYTPLYTATQKKNLTMANLLLTHGVDPHTSFAYGYSPILFAVDFNDKLLLDIFLNEEAPIVKELYRLILEGNTSSFKTIFPDFCEEIALNKRFIEILYLIAINNHQFAIADTIYQSKNGLFSRSTDKTFISDKEPDAFLLETYFSFPDDMPLAIRDGFVYFCSNVAGLLANTKLCLSLFNDLDQDILSRQEELGVDFAAFKPGDGFWWDNCKWPSACDESQVFVSTDGLLRYLLRQQLNKHGIDTQNTLYQFVGFVDSTIANSLVAGGALFKEQFLIGTALRHGLYSHYLQWYLVSKALDNRILHLPDSMTLADVFKYIVATTYYKSPLWSRMVDHIFIDFAQNFSSPQGLNMMLLTTEKLPVLRGYLLNSWYKNIRKMQHVIKDITQNTISYETIIIGQSISANVFNRFKPGITGEDVSNYCKTSKTQGVIDEGTGIMTKVSSERLARWSNDAGRHLLSKPSGLFSSNEANIHASKAPERNESGSDVKFPNFMVI